MNISFEAVISHINSRDIIRLPLSASEQLPSRGMVMVRGILNSISFQAPLEPDGRGGHWFEVSPALKSQLGDLISRPLSIQLEAISDWSEPEIPDDIMDAIIREGLLDQWNSLTVKARWEWLRWIRSTNNPQTRQKRIIVACSKLHKGSRRPCCFNASQCTIPEVSKSGILLD